MPAPVQVVVIEDDPLFREVIVNFINQSPDFHCARYWDNGATALREIPDHPPGLILIDIDLPGLSGTECTAQLKRRWPEIPLIILTGHSGTEHIFEALQAGANGYLLKHTAAKKLLEAMREVMQGGAPMTGAIAAKVIETFRAKPVATVPTAAPATEALSDREFQVLEKLARGLAAKEIAAELGVSFETVRTYIRRIYAKLHTRSRGETVARYFQMRKN
jgi:DNA-binding NarL/FixJ family response regulator